jgi:antitoxin YefM
MKTRISKQRNNLHNLVARAVMAKEVIRIKNKYGTAVILSEAEYDNLVENLHIRSDFNNYSHLIHAIEQFEDGQHSVHELLEDE